jgi:hypothetical protein
VHYNWLRRGAAPPAAAHRNQPVCWQRNLHNIRDFGGLWYLPKFVVVGCVTFHQNFLYYGKEGVLDSFIWAVQILLLLGHVEGSVELQPTCLLPV